MSDHSCQRKTKGGKKHVTLFHLGFTVERMLILKRRNDKGEEFQLSSDKKNCSRQHFTVSTQEIAAE